LTIQGGLHSEVEQVTTVYTFLHESECNVGRACVSRAHKKTIGTNMFSGSKLVLIVLVNTWLAIAEGDSVHDIMLSTVSVEYIK
jgi:hypothetical protein